MLAWARDGWLPMPDLTPIRCWYPQAVRVEPLESDGGDADALAPDWEAACIREVQQGRPEAFNPLVVHYAPRIRAYLYRMLRSREEAEDLTQETFLKAFRALPRFDAARPFKRWLYTIATNTGLNAIRARGRRGDAVELDAENLPSTPEPGGVPSEHRAPGPGEHLESALANLSPRALQLVTLHYHEGFSLQEAGAVLGISESAAKVALCRARRQLRSAMLEGYNDGM